MLSEPLLLQNPLFLSIKLHKCSNFQLAIIFRLYRDYESLRDGTVADCLSDLTGGIPERYHLRQLVVYKNSDTRQNVFDSIVNALNAKAFVTATIKVNSETNRRPGGQNLGHESIN